MNFDQFIPAEFEIIKPGSDEEHRIFLGIAVLMSRFSKCRSKQVGCVIVKDRRIISSGCNGTPTGAVNCCDLFDASKMSDPEYRKLHHAFSVAMECHAEQNAILMAARHPNAVDGATFYVSMKPCEDCLKMIANLRVKKIFYVNEYDMFRKYDPEVEQMIADLGIEIRKISVE